MWPYWAIYCTLGKFLKPLATINLPKSPKFLAIFVQVWKSIIFLVKSILVNVYGHLAIFFRPHWFQDAYCGLPFRISWGTCPGSTAGPRSWSGPPRPLPFGPRCSWCSRPRGASGTNRLHTTRWRTRRILLRTSPGVKKINSKIIKFYYSKFIAVS